MGYFSELDLEIREEDFDLGYHHSFEEQLIMRFEELKERYAELSEKDAAFSEDDYFSKADYRYASVECFKTLYDVSRAMDTVKEELLERCNIVMHDDGSIEPVEEIEEPDPNQISILEFIYFPMLLATSAAA